MEKMCNLRIRINSFVWVVSIDWKREKVVK